MPNPAPQRDPVLTLLTATYSTFRDAKPLAIGIHKALRTAHPDISKFDLHRVMKRHTSSTKYLKMVAAGGHRYGLDGVADGEVTAEQQKQANDELKERFRKRAESLRATEKAKIEAEKARLHQEKLNQLLAKFG
jgi:sRNA-binding protein